MTEQIFSGPPLPSTALLQATLPATHARIQNPERAAEVGIEFEAVFLTEMLRHTGLTEAFGKISGGGADGFSDLMVRELALQIARTRPLGLGELVAERVRRDG